MATTAKNFFTPEQQDDILKAVNKAELNTSGEIRVHIENKCEGDVLARSVYHFQKAGNDQNKTTQWCIILPGCRTS